MAGRITMINKRFGIFALTLILCFSGTLGCSLTRDTVEVSSNSFFDRMIICNERVYFLCYIEFVNNSNYQKTIAVVGESASDVKNGLLIDKNLEFFIICSDDIGAINENNIDQFIQPTNSLSIAANSTAKYWICFLGAHNYGLRKHDRLLPKVKIITLSGD